jgi:hypothetical protein
MLNIKSTTSPFDLGLGTVIDVVIPYEDEKFIVAYSVGWFSSGDSEFRHPEVTVNRRMKLWMYQEAYGLRTDHLSRSRIQVG